MELFEAIARRASYRGRYLDTPVPREDLMRIVQAGIQAPSGKNEQVVSFVIVDDPGLIRHIAAILEKPTLLEAKALIACTADPRPVFEDISFASEDCAASVENMLLALTALGYASVWLDGVLRRENRAARISELLSVPSSRRLLVLLPVGVPAEPCPQREKLPFERRAWFNRYGGGA